MPYELKRTIGSKPWVVVEKKTGEVMGTYETRADAIKQLKALYVAEGKRGRR